MENQERKSNRVSKRAPGAIYSKETRRLERRTMMTDKKITMEEERELADWSEGQRSDWSARL